MGLGSEARMNTPSVYGGNWRWRFDPDQLTSEIAVRLSHLVELSDRVPPPLPKPASESFAA